MERQGATGRGGGAGEGASGEREEKVSSTRRAPAAGKEFAVLMLLQSGFQRSALFILSTSEGLMAEMCPSQCPTGPMFPYTQRTLAPTCSYWMNQSAARNAPRT
eukprot:CAMPEP_0194771426 /NCGR_PEP_ID=MMETSP0323_2-20130528/49216_1 /TAXON_ID=2866 ORGANISM="Crypthecodinium cohnii, Strain Seligo" /NCGR_SAMPLE_ID=MMETSP0323_2 /ASSEMBLY_ACC=CAM_ASM_000346 /LENGTH=103 /DNA_ID=CAMNT_0039705523 /DNA_START=230 /DNA_END=541 /DNA_ORIENTATION=-